MECNNCGWFNPAGLTRCQKCNQPLKVEDLRKEDQVMFKCVQCGYLLSNAASVCPSCGYMNSSAFGAPVATANNKATVVMNQEPEPQSRLQNNNPKSTVVINMQDTPKPTNPKATVVLNNQDLEPAQQPVVNNPKATVVLGKQDIPRPENPKATVILGESDLETKNNILQSVKPNTKATVVLNQVEETPIKNESANCKQTVRDVSAFYEQQNSTIANTLTEYKLICIDWCGNKPLEIILIPSEDFNLSKNDIILISGLRFRVE